MMPLRIHPDSHRTRTVRWAMSLLLATALGFATATGLSWAMSIGYQWSGRAYTYMLGVERPSSTTPNTTELLSYRVTEQGRAGLRRTLITPLVPRWPLTAPLLDQIKLNLLAEHEQRQTVARQMPELVRQAWEYWFTFPAHAPTNIQSLTHRAVGWPMLCLRSESWTDASGKQHDRGLLRLVPAPPPTLGASDPLLGTIPLLPIWRGALCNTLLFASIWWASLYAPRTWRRHRRHSRGLCPQCGYDLRHAFALGCPECGWNRPNNPPA